MVSRHIEETCGEKGVNTEVYLSNLLKSARIECVFRRGQVGIARTTLTIACPHLLFKTKCSSNLLDVHKMLDFVSASQTILMEHLPIFM